jgi:hypothetical protein
MPTRLFSLIALLCLSTALHAQSVAPALHDQSKTSARYQIYGGYAFLSNSLNGVPASRQPLNGFDASVAFKSWHNLRFKIDFSSYSGSNLGAPQHPYYILGGGQYTWRIGKESVFVEVLGGTGGANRSWGTNTADAIGQTASVATLAGGGLDTPVTRHIAFRVEGGFQYSYFGLMTPVHEFPFRIPGLPTNFGRISSGLVWKF